MGRDKTMLPFGAETMLQRVVRILTPTASLQRIAQDKQDNVDNILPLMEKSLAYVLRNIQGGVTAAGGGARSPQYPEELLRETVNNARRREC